MDSQHVLITVAKFAKALSFVENSENNYSLFSWPVKNYQCRLELSRQMNAKGRTLVSLTQSHCAMGMGSGLLNSTWQEKNAPCNDTSHLVNQVSSLTAHLVPHYIKCHKCNL